MRMNATRTTGAFVFEQLRMLDEQLSLSFEEQGIRRACMETPDKDTRETNSETEPMEYDSCPIYLDGISAPYWVLTTRKDSDGKEELYFVDACYDPRLTSR